MAENENESVEKRGLKVASDKTQQDAIALCEGFYNLAEGMELDAEMAAITMMVAAFMLSECGLVPDSWREFGAKFMDGVLATAGTMRPRRELTH